MSKSRIPSKSDNAIFRAEKRDSTAIILLDCETHFFTLTKVASEVWHLINGKNSEQVIVEKIAGKHKKSLVSVRKLVSRLLSGLAKERLIVW